MPKKTRNTTKSLLATVACVVAVGGLLIYATPTPDSPKRAMRIARNVDLAAAASNPNAAASTPDPNTSPVNVATSAAPPTACADCRGITLRVPPHGEIRLHLRREWCPLSEAYAADVAAAAQKQDSSVYRLEPGFLIQGRLSAPSVPKLRKSTRATKVMERGEVGWAGGGSGPDYFIYLGDGPASWLGVPHEGTVFAQVADEESMAVANNISLVPVGPTKPGAMHIITPELKMVPSAYLGGRALLRHGAPQLLKVAGTTADAEAAACPATCHALAHTEMHGSVVKWGANHLQPTAAACCAACAALETCNVWVWCGSRTRCGTMLHQCWLKSAPRLWEMPGARSGGEPPPAILVGQSNMWISGTRLPAPADHPSGAGFRSPTKADADLALELELGVGEGQAPVRLRLALRDSVAPRAAARIRAALAAAAAAAGDACLGAGCALTAATPTPAGWGSEELPDGTTAGSRWPSGAALLEGTLGRVGTPRTGAPPQPVESNGTHAVRRGAAFWTPLGARAGDGPEFCVALADMPHMGVSQTVFAYVVSDDLPRLDELAADAAAGRLRLPARLSLVGLPPSIPEI